MIEICRLVDVVKLELAMDKLKRSRCSSFVPLDVWLGFATCGGRSASEVTGAKQLCWFFGFRSKYEQKSNNVTSCCGLGVLI